MALSKKPTTRWPELDELTLARVKRGEATAARTLVTHYQAAVFAVIGRLMAPVGKADAVDDLAQETFLRVFREIPGFSTSGPARLSTWILTIATRLAIDELRRRSLDVDDSASEPVDLSSFSPESSMDRQQLGDAIADAVRTLPTEFRAAFILRAYHERSYDEIAVVLDCDVGTVKSRISRAKARLRTQLQGVRA